MSLYPILWAAEHAPIYDAEERAILMALVMKGDFDGMNCFRSYNTLARVARVNRKTAERKCHAMEARSILRRQTKYLSKTWLSIPRTQRPVVWEVMIPAEWWSPAQLADINEQRASIGRPVLTAETRPPIAEAPPKKSRADKGKPRPKRQKDQPADPGTTSPHPNHPRDFKSPGDPGTTSPQSRNLKSPAPGLQVPQPSESPSESPSLSPDPSVAGVPDAPADARTGERETAAPEDNPTPSAEAFQKTGTADDGPSQVLAAYEEALGGQALNGTRTQLLADASELLAVRPLWWVVDRARELPRYGKSLARHAEMSKAPFSKPASSSPGVGGRERCPDHPGRYRKGCIDCAMTLPA